MVFLFLLFSVLFNYIFESERWVQGSENLKGNIAFFSAFANKHTHTNQILRRSFDANSCIVIWFKHFITIFHGFFLWEEKKRVKNAKTFDLNQKYLTLIDVWQRALDFFVFFFWKNFRLFFARFILALQTRFRCWLENIFSHGLMIGVQLQKNRRNTENLFQVWTFGITMAILFFDDFSRSLCVSFTLINSKVSFHCRKYLVNPWLTHTHTRWQFICSVCALLFFLSSLFLCINPSAYVTFQIRFMLKTHPSTSIFVPFLVFLQLFRPILLDANNSLSYSSNHVSKAIFAFKMQCISFVQLWK